MLKSICVVSITFLLPFSAYAVADCDPDAERAFSLGQKADANDDQDAALKYYRNAARACDRSDYWQAVGDILVNDYFGSLSPDEILENGGQATDAYTNALNAAETSEEQLAAAKGLANLGILSGDPLNAKEWLGFASQISPDDPEIEEMRVALQAQEAKGISETEIRRARGTADSVLFGSVALIDETPIISDGVNPAPKRAVSAPAQTTKTAKAQKIAIPVNFGSNSTQPDERTAANVKALASVLLEEDSSASFVFVGHADRRGEEWSNQQLSESRAVAIKQTIETIYPELKGRITAEGAGESQPMDYGSSETSLAANRRLEVWIKYPE
ncbi:MAG: OmpA family protein [Gammaproteobacteria bacterium]